MLHSKSCLYSAIDDIITVMCLIFICFFAQSPLIYGRLGGWYIDFCTEELLNVWTKKNSSMPLLSRDKAIDSCSFAAASANKAGPITKYILKNWLQIVLLNPAPPKSLPLKFDVCVCRSLLAVCCSAPCSSSSSIRGRGTQRGRLGQTAEVHLQSSGGADRGPGGGHCSPATPPPAPYCRPQLPPTHKRGQSRGGHAAEPWSAAGKQSQGGSCRGDQVLPKWAPGRGL